MVPSESMGSLGCLLFFLGGLIPALLYADANSRKVQCGHCGHIFRQPPLPNSPVSSLAKATFMILLLFLFTGFLLAVEPAFSAGIPRLEWLKGAEAVIAGNPYVVAFCLAAFTATLVVIIALTSIISNAKFRSNLRKEHHVRPEPFSHPRSENSPADDAAHQTDA